MENLYYFQGDWLPDWTKEEMEAILDESHKPLPKIKPKLLPIRPNGPCRALLGMDTPESN